MKYNATMETLGGRLIVPRCQVAAKSGLQCGQPAKAPTQKCYMHQHVEILVGAIEEKPTYIRPSRAKPKDSRTESERAEIWAAMVSWLENSKPGAPNGVKY